MCTTAARQGWEDSRAAIRPSRSDVRAATRPSSSSSSFRLVSACVTAGNRRVSGPNPYPSFASYCSGLCVAALAGGGSAPGAAGGGRAPRRRDACAGGPPGPYPLGLAGGCREAAADAAAQAETDAGAAGRQGGATVRSVVLVPVTDRIFMVLCGAACIPGLAGRRHPFGNARSVGSAIRSGRLERDSRTADARWLHFWHEDDTQHLATSLRAGVGGLSRCSGAARRAAQGRAVSAGSGPRRHGCSWVRWCGGCKRLLPIGCQRDRLLAAARRRATGVRNRCETSSTRSGSTPELTMMKASASVPHLRQLSQLCKHAKTQC